MSKMDDKVLTYLSRVAQLCQGRLPAVLVPARRLAMVTYGSIMPGKRTLRQLEMEVALSPLVNARQPSVSEPSGTFAMEALIGCSVVLG